MIEEAKLMEIVGTENVSSEENSLIEYSRDLSFVNFVKPVCVVKPKTVLQIQSLVKMARHTQTPLVPISGVIQSQASVVLSWLI